MLISGLIFRLTHFAIRLSLIVGGHILLGLRSVFSVVFAGDLMHDISYSGRQVFFPARKAGFCLSSKRGG